MMAIDEETVDGLGEQQGQNRSSPSSQRLSVALQALGADESRSRISIRDLFAALGDRAIGALMLVFALPNIFPTPPGTSAILGAPLVFLTAQLTLGMSPWLPGIIANRSMAREDFAKVAARITPWLARAERLLKPRLTWLVLPPVEYVIGLLSLLLAIVLALPVPLGNMLPALAICFFSFAILERDGVCMLLGMVMAGVSTLVVGGVAYALLKALIFLISSVLI
nr:exopolysaccharide biosynthesis protein [uncultured Gellertiella sp.]